MIKIYESVTVRNNMSLRLKCGKATVKFEFERGNVAKGIRAKYITNDPFMQHVLDTSDSLNNLYQLAKSIPETGEDTTKIAEAQALAQKAQQAAKQAYAAVMAEGTAETAEPAEGTSGNAEGTVADGTAAEGTSGNTEGTVTASTTPKGTSMKEMKFADAAEVIVYLMSNYGVQAESLEAATKELRKHKINPVVG